MPFGISKSVGVSVSTIACTIALAAFASPASAGTTTLALSFNPFDPLALLRQVETLAAQDKAVVVAPAPAATSTDKVQLLVEPLRDKPKKSKERDGNGDDNDNGGGNG